VTTRTLFRSPGPLLSEATGVKGRV